MNYSEFIYFIFLEFFGITMSSLCKRGQIQIKFTKKEFRDIFPPGSTGSIPKVMGMIFSWRDCTLQCAPPSGKRSLRGGGGGGSASKHAGLSCLRAPPSQGQSTQWGEGRKFTWNVNYVSEIIHSSISDTIGTRARRINSAAALCCSVALIYGAAILRLENEARHANFEKALFQSVTKWKNWKIKNTGG